jgi:hypothetical protein
VRNILITLIIIMPIFIQARTLRNVTLDEVVEKASEVVMLKVIETRLLEVEQIPDIEPSSNNVEKEPYEEEEATFHGIYSSNCGINVKAKIIHNYKSSKSQYIEFTTMEHIETGSSYLAFLNDIESKSWYSSMFSYFKINGKVPGSHPNEIKCLENSRELKALAFPQRLIKYDEERWLDVSLNNIHFPTSVLVKVEGEQSVIQQYNVVKVDFETVHEYLLSLKTEKSSNKKLVTDAKDEQNN